MLVDAGDGRRLERFGPRLVDRPAPAAEAARRDPAAWFGADLRFSPGRGWSARGGADPSEAWTVEVDALTLELRPTSGGGLGLYPEHASSLGWLAASVARRRAESGTATGAAATGAAAAAGSEGGEAAPRVLNLFAHTGLATLALARAGAAVAHVDAARTAVAWARRNAELSWLADRPVRWLVDDAIGFVEREVRRGRRYAGFVLDPPSFGRAPKGRGGRGGRGGEWSLREGLPRLLDGCAAIAEDDAFVLLTAHSTGLEPEAMADALRAAFDAGRPSVQPLRLTAESGARMDLGWTVRLDPLDAAP